jgi:hypothetical protein
VGDAELAVEHDRSDPVECDLEAEVERSKGGNAVGGRTSAGCRAVGVTVTVARAVVVEERGGEGVATSRGHRQGEAGRREAVESRTEGGSRPVSGRTKEHERRKTYVERRSS